MKDIRFIVIDSGFPGFLMTRCCEKGDPVSQLREGFRSGPLPAAPDGGEKAGGSPAGIVAAEIPRSASGSFALFV